MAEKIAQVVLPIIPAGQEVLANPFGTASDKDRRIKGLWAQPGSTGYLRGYVARTQVVNFDVSLFAAGGQHIAVDIPLPMGSNFEIGLFDVVGAGIAVGQEIDVLYFEAD